MKFFKFILLPILACAPITARAGESELDKLKKQAESTIGLYPFRDDDVKIEDLKNILRLHDVIKKRFNLKSIRSGKNAGATLGGFQMFEENTRGIVGVNLENRFNLLFEYGHERDQVYPSPIFRIEIYRHQTIRHDFQGLLLQAQKVIDEEKVEHARVAQEISELDTRQAECERMVEDLRTRLGINIELVPPSATEDIRQRKERIERTFHNLTEAKGAIDRVHNRLGVLIVGDETGNVPSDLNFYSNRIDLATRKLGESLDFKGLRLVTGYQYGVSFDQSRGVVIVPWREEYQRNLVSVLQNLVNQNKGFIRTELEVAKESCKTNLSGQN